MSTISDGAPDHSFRCPYCKVVLNLQEYDAVLKVNRCPFCSMEVDFRPKNKEQLQQQHLATQARAAPFKFETVDIPETIPQDVLNQISAPTAWEMNVLPLWLEYGMLIVAYHEPMDMRIEEKLHFLTNHEIRAKHAEKDDIRVAIERFYFDDEIPG